MDTQSGSPGGSAPEPTAPSRVMAWSPTSGWTVQRVNPDQAKRQRREALTVAACTLAGDRHRKRPVESGAAVAGPSKRRRAMGPPGPLPTAHGKKAHQHRPQPVAHASTATTATTTKITVGNSNNKSKHTKTSTVTTTARKRPLAMAAAAAPSSRSAPEPVPVARRHLFAQTPPRQWKRVRMLGCGTFGCVREVIHPKTGDRAAIKEMGLLPNDYRGSRDGALGDAFRPGISPPSIHMAFRELAAVAALSDHPSVAPVRDAYLAMPRTGAGAGVSSGIECALLMDLMDGHLGRVVRFLAGHGDARPRSASTVAPLFDSAPTSSRMSAEATSSSSLALSATSSSASSLPFSSSSSSLVSSLFSSAGPLCPTLASTSPSSSSATSVTSSSSSSSTSSSTSTSSPPVPASPLRARDTSSVSCQTAQRHSTTPMSLVSNATSNKSAACPFALRVHVARLVARDILPALVFMHERLGMAHRDIKPNNILYSGDMASGAMRFRLADFGLARFVREPQRDASPHRRRRSKRRSRDATGPSQNHAEPGDTSTPLTSLPSCQSTAPTTTGTLDQDNSGATDGTEPERPKKKARANAREKADKKDDDDDNNSNRDDGNKGDGKAGSRLGPCFTANVVTHLYKPPELLLHYATRRATDRGLAYGCAVDMWSFGVVLMEVLAGGHLTPSEPEETLVKRVRGVFRLDGPPRPHLVRDLVCAMEARAATGRSGVGSIPRVPSHATTDAKVSVNDTQKSCPPTACHNADGCSFPPSSSSAHDDLIDLVERLLCVDPLQRMTATEAMRHPFVTTNSGGDVDSADSVGLSSVPEPRPRFLGACEYKALGAESSRAAERARAGDPTITTCTLAARKVAVARACAFADRYDLKTHTVACAVAMLDHYLERAASCNDEAILLVSAGALLVACSLYECRWPSYDQFVSLGVVPPAWYGVDRRAPSVAVRTPAPDAVLRAAVDLFNTLDHMTPHVDAVTPLIDGSLAIGRERKDASPWRAMTATFSRYPPSLTLTR